MNLRCTPHNYQEYNPALHMHLGKHKIDSGGSGCRNVQFFCGGIFGPSTSRNGWSALKLTVLAVGAGMSNFFAVVSLDLVHLGMDGQR